jgi:hypothetical protein
MLSLPAAAAAVDSQNFCQGDMVFSRSMLPLLLTLLLLPPLGAAAWRV